MSVAPWVALGGVGVLGMVLVFVLALRLSDAAEREHFALDARRVAELGQRAAERERDAAVVRATTLVSALDQERAARAAADAATLAAQEEVRRARAAEADHLDGDDLARRVDEQLRGQAPAVSADPGSSGGGATAATTGHPVRPA